MESHHGTGGNGGVQHLHSDGWSVTVDEVKVKHQLGDLGKPHGSTNLDELIKSAWTAEAEANQHTKHASASSIARQSSLADLIKKTVDEMWQDIQQGQNKKIDAGDSNDGKGGGGYNLDKKTVLEKQPTPGEMTLEDFLAKEGIVAQPSQEKKISASDVGAESIALPKQNINPQQAQWLRYQIPPIQHQQYMSRPDHHQGQHLPSSANPKMDVAYSETQMTMSPPGWKRGRVASGDMMKTVERRHERMMKNRESAARSRARKEAYTHELENKVSRLEENKRLKREQVQHLPSSANTMMDATYSETKMTMSPPSLMGTLSETQTPGQKRGRVASGDIMKPVEKRQRRMMKNREAAARSRARKQAYTYELENKVSHLEEENKRLKREQEAENVLPYVPPLEPKYQLRRTSSALF